MSNTTVDRLAVDKKQVSFFAVPPFPPVPALALKRAPELSAWSVDVAAWRDRFSAYLKAQIQALAQVDDTESETLTARITELESELRNDINEALEGVAGAATPESVAGKVNRTGDTMTGILNLWRDPELDLEAVTKQYVDNRINSIGGPYVHNQASASATWTITHHRNKYPGGIVVMTGASNNEITAERQDVSANQVILRFGAAYNGRAILPF